MKQKTTDSFDESYTKALPQRDLGRPPREFVLLEKKREEERFDTRYRLLNRRELDLLRSSRA